MIKNRRERKNAKDWRQTFLSAKNDKEIKERKHGINKNETK